jgi:hypothetical protein
MNGMNGMNGMNPKKLKWFSDINLSAGYDNVTIYHQNE